MYFLTEQKVDGDLWNGLEQIANGIYILCKNSQAKNETMF